MIQNNSYKNTPTYLKLNPIFSYAVIAIKLYEPKVPQNIYSLLLF